MALTKRRTPRHVLIALAPTLAVGLALLGCRMRTPPPQPQFIATDLHETKAWLAELSKPTLRAIRDKNEPQCEQRVADLERQLAATPTGTTVRWAVQVVEVKDREVRVKGADGPRPRDEGGIRLHVTAHPEGVPAERGTVSSDSLQIGPTVDGTRAKTLKAGDPLVVVGKLEKLALSVVNHDDQWLMFSATLSGVRAE